MVCCCAVGCSNRSEEGFRLHRFPRNEIRRAAWISQANRKNWIPTDNSRLCEVHFDINQWEPLPLRNGIKKLKRDAIPSVFTATKRVLRISKKTLKIGQIRKVSPTIARPKRHIDDAASSTNVESEDDDTDRAALCESLKLDKCTQIISIQQIIDLLPESGRLRAENDKLRKKEIELIIKENQRLRVENNKLRRRERELIKKGKTLRTGNNELQNSLVFKQ